MNVYYEVGNSWGFCFKPIIARTEEDAVLQILYKRHLDVKKQENDKNEIVPLFGGLKRLPPKDAELPKVVHLSKLGDVPAPIGELSLEHINQLNEGIRLTQNAWEQPIRKRPCHSEIIFEIGDKSFIIYNERFDSGHKFLPWSFQRNSGDNFIKDINARLIGSNNHSKGILYEVDRLTQTVALVSELDMKWDYSRRNDLGKIKEVSQGDDVTYKVFESLFIK